MIFFIILLIYIPKCFPIWQMKIMFKCIVEPVLSCSLICFISVTPKWVIKSSGFFLNLNIGYGKFCFSISMQVSKLNSIWNIFCTLDLQIFFFTAMAIEVITNPVFFLTQNIAVSHHKITALLLIQRHYQKIGYHYLLMLMITPMKVYFTKLCHFSGLCTFKFIVLLL